MEEDSPPIDSLEEIGVFHLKDSLPDEIEVDIILLAGDEMLDKVVEQVVIVRSGRIEEVGDEPPGR